MSNSKNNATDESPVIPVAVSSAVPAQAHWLVFNNTNHPITVGLGGGQGDLVLGARRRETVIGQPVSVPQGIVTKQLD